MPSKTKLVSAGHKLFIVSLLLSFLACKQNENPNAQFLKQFFSTYAPCIEPFYCYEYSFDTEGDTLKIEWRLFNYQGVNEDEKTLIEVTDLQIPLKKIKAIDYFPNHSEYITINTMGNDIRKTKKGKDEFVDYIPIDFDKFRLTDDLKAQFKENFNSVIFPSGVSRFGDSALRILSERVNSIYETVTQPHHKQSSHQNQNVPLGYGFQ